MRPVYKGILKKADSLLFDSGFLERAIHDFVYRFKLFPECYFRYYAAVFAVEVQALRYHVGQNRAAVLYNGRRGFIT